jgi:hypothetical protein
VHTQYAPDVVTSALSFEDRVVALTTNVLTAKEELFIALAILFNPVGRVLPSPLGVETPQSLLQLVELLVVDVVLEEDILTP